MFEVDGYDSGGGKCFVSWSGELVRADNDTDGVLQINGLFGEKLGLKDKDQVRLALTLSPLAVNFEDH